MKILAVDTSTEICSLCFAEPGLTIAEFVSRSEKTHTERLLPAIDFLLNQVSFSLKDLNGLAVIHGPGSFTGLRISLSVVKGLALALGCPVVAMNALEVAAEQVKEEGWICPAMDAKRGEVFSALFRRENGILISVLPPVSVAPAKWKEQLPEAGIHFCGPGAALHFDILRKGSGSNLVFKDFILAPTLAEKAFRSFTEGKVSSGDLLRAAYLRPSDAEISGPKARKQLERTRYNRKK